MIELVNVHKRYPSLHGPHWVLRGITLKFLPRQKVALIGANGAGKSTLLRLVGGIDRPDRGRVTRRCRVSWPVGLQGGMQPALTGRQNARFVCRVHGFGAEVHERTEYVKDFSELGDAFDEPTSSYSPGMRARLAFSLSMAFDFDVYLVDEVMSVGDAAFRKKAGDAFKALASRSGMILASHNEDIVRSFCNAAIWLHKGRAQWFDSVDEALAAYSGKKAA